MKIRNSSKINKINKINLIFSISYVLFVFSLFNRDVSDIDILYPLTIPAKYIALVILTAGIMFRAYSKKQIQVVIILLCADLLVLVKSGALIFILISLFAFFANKLEDKDILRVAYFTLLFFTLCVFIFSIIGIYNDEITKRWVDSATRHSLGFYHSNVLPLIYSYLVGYGLLIGIFKKKHYFILLTIDLVIYYFCGSRNSLFTTFLLVLGKWFIDSVIETGKFKKIINRIVGFGAKFIVPFLAAFSIFIPLMVDKVVAFRMLDYVLSYRFTYIASMIQNLGISLIPKMTNKTYFENEIVIDNGYAFLTIRYGVLMIIFLSILIYCVAKKYKNNTFVLFLIIVVACINLIDNDLIDYSVLPYLIISEKCLIEGLRRRSGYGRSHKRNNEYLQ